MSSDSSQWKLQRAAGKRRNGIATVCRIANCVKAIVGMTQPIDFRAGSRPRRPASGRGAPARRGAPRGGGGGGGGEASKGFSRLRRDKNSRGEDDFPAMGGRGEIWMRGVARHSSGGFCNFVRAGAATNPDCEGSRPSAFSLRTSPPPRGGGADTCSMPLNVAMYVGFSAPLIRRERADSGIAIGISRDILPPSARTQWKQAGVQSRDCLLTRGEEGKGPPERMQHCLRNQSVRPFLSFFRSFFFFLTPLNLSRSPSEFSANSKIARRPTKWINGRGGDAAGFSRRSGCVGIFSTFDVTGRNRPKIRA